MLDQRRVTKIYKNKNNVNIRVCCKCFEGYTHKEENVMFFIVFDVGLLKYVKRECFIEIRT